jgi:hypothetical protein
LKRLTHITRARGDEPHARVMEAESRPVYEEPERDSAVEAALQQACGSGNIEHAIEVLKQQAKKS